MSGKKIPEVAIDMEMPFPGCFMWRTDCVKCGARIQTPMVIRADVKALPPRVRLCPNCDGKNWGLVKEAEEMARERLAAVQHEIWSHWMSRMFAVCYERHVPVLDYDAPPYDPANDPHGLGPLPAIKDDEIDMVVPAKLVKRWKRQMETPYSDLSEKEKDSDREQADKVLEALEGK
jgi:hypothetical protein